MQFKTKQGKGFASNFDKSAIDFIMQCKLVSGSGVNRNMIPYPFSIDEIKEIENIFYTEFKDDSVMIKYIRDYHLFSTRRLHDKAIDIADDVESAIAIDEIKDFFNREIMLNWDLCEELFGGTGETIHLEDGSADLAMFDGSVYAETMAVFEDTILFYFAYLATSK